MNTYNISMIKEIDLDLTIEKLKSKIEQIELECV